MNPVVLFRPSYLERKGTHPGALDMHLGLLVVGGALKQAGHEVVLIDGLIHEDWPERLARESGGALFVGVTAMTPQVGQGIAAARIVRELCPEVPLVWGGAHPSIFPDQTARSPLCDVAVVGEADETVVELARAFEGGLDLDGIEGIARLTEGVVAFTPRTCITERFDDLADPDYTLYGEEDLEVYITAARTFATERPWRTLPIHCGRGCRFRCSFCIATMFPETCGRHRAKSASRIINEMMQLGERYGVDEFFLQDEDFFTDQGRVCELLDLYERYDLTCKWHALGRASSFRDGSIDRAFCERLLRCGAVSLSVGVESGSARMLKRIKKGITPEMVRRMARTVAGTELELCMCLMVGMPGEEREDMIDTVRIVWEVDKLASGNIELGGPSTFRPYPGTEMYRETLEAGFKAPTSLEGWSALELGASGYLDAASVPWLGDRQLFRYVSKILPSVFFRRDTRHRRLKELLRALYLPLLALRVRRNWWRGLVELKLYDGLEWLWRRFVPSLK